MDISLNDVLNFTPAGLRAKQHEILKEHVSQVLERVQEIIDGEDYDKVEEYTFFSPAGDGYGSDNDCINFGTKEQPMDIASVVFMLKQFKGKPCQPKQNKQD